MIGRSNFTDLDLDCTHQVGNQRRAMTSPHRVTWRSIKCKRFFPSCLFEILGLIVSGRNLVVVEKPEPDMISFEVQQQQEKLWLRTSSEGIALWPEGASKFVRVAPELNCR